MVDSAKAVVILAFAPERIVQNAQKLKGFVERASTVVRHVGESFCDVRQPFVGGLHAVTVCEVENGVK